MAAKSLLFTMGFWFVFGGFPAPVSAAVGVPKIISHQGRLLDAAGNLLGGAGTQYCFKFSLYDDATVGAPDVKLWPAGTPSTMTVTVKDGVYNVGIGDAAAGGDLLDYDFQSNDGAYLNIEVATKVGATCAPGDGAESFENLSPRQRVVSSGYAVNADTVDGFHAAQSASGSQIPALTSGNLVLGGVNPQVDASGANNLVVQGGGGTGDVQFFSSANKLTSAGNLTVAGTVTSGGLIVNGAATDIQSGTNENLTLDPNGTGNLVIVGLDCTSNANGGKLTVNASGVVSCADDVGPSGTLLTLAGSSGPSQALVQGDTLSILAGADITSVASATGTVTIADTSTLATVTGRGASTSTASSFNGGASIRGLAVDTATSTDDRIKVAITAGGAARFDGTVTNADLTAARTYTLPNASGTFAVSASAPLSLSAAGDVSCPSCLVSGGSLFSTVGDTGTSTISQGGTLTLAGGGDFTTTDNGSGTITLSDNSTLSSVTGRGASTSTSLTFSGGFTASSGVNLTGAVLAGASPFVFDGATPDANTLTLAVTDPTAARTITFPNASGTLMLQGGSLFTAAATSGSSSAVSQGGTLTFAAGVDVTTTGNGAGTVTIADTSTLATVTGRGASTSTASSFNGGASIRGLAVDTATSTDDRIKVAITAGGAARFDGTVTNADLTAARTYTLPNASGTFAVSASAPLSLSAAGDVSCPSCLVSGGSLFAFAGTSGSSSTINEGGTAIVAAGTNLTTTGNGTGTVTVATVPNPTFSTSVTTPTLQNAGADLTIQTTTSGNVILQPSGSGTTALVQIGAGDGGSTTPDLLALDVKGDAGDPSGANGELYYNQNAGKFRCFEGGTWKDCIPTQIFSLSSLTAATGANLINNGDFLQRWNWSLTSADQTGMLFGENVPSTASGTPSIVSARALATSTAIPLYVTNLGDAASFRVDDDSSDTTPFVVSKDGNVGIGTDTFDAVLPEKLKIEGGTGQRFVISGAGDINNNLFLNINNRNAGATAAAVVSAAADNFSGVLNTVAMGMTSSGYSNPSFPNAGPDDAFLLSMGKNLVLASVAPGNPDNIKFTTGFPAVERMRIAGTGNVGIGTTSPGSTLDVKGTLRLSGSTSGYVGLTVPAAAGSTTYTFPSADGTGGYVLATDGSGALSWVDAATKWSRIGTTLSPLVPGDDVTTSGDISTSGTGTITSAGLLTGSAGFSASGGDVNLNAGSNHDTNINTGTSTGSVTIGNALAGPIVLRSATSVTLQGATSTLTTGGSDIVLQPAGTGTTAKVQVGAGGAGSTTPDLLALDVKSDTGDPSGANGEMYYNANANKFRCFVNGSWSDCDTTGGSSTLQSSYNAGNTITTSGATAIAFTLTSGDFTASGAGSVNLTPTGASSFTSGGALTLTGGAASTWGTSSGDLALQINGTGTGILHVGTGAGTSTPDLLAVDVKNDNGSDPAGGTNGAMYYNTTANKFRCYEAGGWKDCDTGVGASSITLQQAYTQGNAITTSGSTDIAFTLASGDFTASGAGSVNLTPTGASSFTSGGALTLTGGAASIWSTSAGNLTIDAAAALNLGTTNATSVAIGRTGVTTTNNGALTSTQTLTASNGFTLTTGALNLTATSGALALSGLGASSIDAGANSLALIGSPITLNATGSGTTTIGSATGAVNLPGLTVSKVVFTDASKNLTSTGTVAINQGGTGQTAKTAAFDALSPNSAKGDITVFDGTNNVRLPVVGTNNFVLQVDSTQATGLKWGPDPVSSLQGAYGGGSSITTASNTDISFILASGNFTASGAGSVNLTPTGASSFTSGGALTLTGGAASTWSTSVGNLTIDAAAALNLGTTNATSVGIGRNGVTTQVGGTLTAAGTVNANGGTIATNQTTFNLVNANASTVNFAGAATTLNIGAATGTATVNNAVVNLQNGDLQTAGTQRLSNGGALSNITGYAQTSGAFSSTLTTTNSAAFSSTSANTDTIAIKPQTTTAIGSFTGTLTSADLTAARTWTLPNADGIIAVSASGPITLSAAGNIDCPTCEVSGGAVFTFAGTSGSDSTINEGGTATVAAGTDIATTGDGAGTVTIADASTLATVTGRGATTSTGLTFSGGFTASSGVNLTGAVIAGASPLVFDGLTADTNKLTLAVTDPTAARIITFPNASGTLLLTGGSLFTSQGDSGSSTISQGGTLKVAGGTDMSTADNGSGIVTVNNTSTLATVTGRGATTSTASSFNGGASIRGLTVDDGNATNDRILTTITPGGAARFDGTVTNADLTAARTWTLPDASGTVVVSGSTLFTLAGTSGSNQTISQGDTLTIAAGTNLTTTGGATDTVTVATVNNPTFSTSVTTPIVDNAGSLTLGGTNATSVAIGSAAVTTTVNGNLTVAADKNLTMASGTGVFTQTFTGTGTTAHTIAAGSLTAGSGLAITGGAAMTTGSLLTGTSATYVHAGAETGKLVGLSFTDASTNAAGSAVTTGLDIASAFNTSASAGPKTINAINIPAPTLTACGTTGGSCTWNGMQLATAALTQSTTNAFAMNGLNLSSAGALVQNTAAGTITWKGLNVVMPNLTQTTGTVTSSGLDITMGTTTTGGTQTGLRITDSSTIATAATDKAILVRDGSNNSLFEVRDMTSANNNFGAAVTAGALIDRTSTFREEFNSFHANTTGTTVQARGDGSGTNGGELSAGIVIAGGASVGTAASQNATNGVERLSAVSGNAIGRTATVLEYLGTATAGTPNDIYTAANLPVVTVKAMAANVGANNRVFLGISDAGVATTTMPTNGIFFSNCSTGGATPTCDANWYGVVNNAGTVTTVSCGAVDTAHFAFGRIEVRSTTDVHFFMDTNASDGIVETECGTGLTTTPSVTMSVMLQAASVSTAAATNTTNLDVDYFRSWQDDANVETTTVAAVPALTVETADASAAPLSDADLLAELTAQLATRPAEQTPVDFSADRLKAGLSVVAPRGLFQGLTVDSIGSLHDALTLASDTVFIGRPYFNSDTGGFAVVKAGDRSVTVTFDRPYDVQPVVNASFSFEEGDGQPDEAEHLVFGDDIRSVIVKKSVNGFTIRLNKAAPIDLKLSWIALAVKDAKTSVSTADVAPSTTSTTSSPTDTGSSAPATTTTTATTSTTDQPTTPAGDTGSAAVSTDTSSPSTDTSTVDQGALSPTSGDTTTAPTDTGSTATTSTTDQPTTPAGDTAGPDTTTAPVDPGPTDTAPATAGQDSAAVTVAQ